jgi:Na+-transporting methylmalonyl-CoA/oxaloacetate decarboxylase gamma subunit
MSFGDSMLVVLIGFGTVFIALVALIAILNIINKMVSLAGKAAEPNIKVNPIDNVDNNNASNDVAVIQGDDGEITAVISAVIAASLNRSTHDIVVKSITRIPSRTPIWNRLGRRDQIASRL